MKTVATLTKLMQLTPATNAVCERSFGSLKRLKTYLRSAMGDDRLFPLMVLHVYKQLTDSLYLVQVANRFAGTNDCRKQMFGTFSKRGMPVKKVFVSNSTQTA